jgi:hypothetical protein
MLPTATFLQVPNELSKRYQVFDRVRVSSINNCLPVQEFACYRIYRFITTITEACYLVQLAHEKETKHLMDPGMYDLVRIGTFCSWDK